MVIHCLSCSFSLRTTWDSYSRGVVNLFSWQLYSCHTITFSACSGSSQWIQFTELNRLRRKDPDQWKICQVCLMMLFAKYLYPKRNTDLLFLSTSRSRCRSWRRVCKSSTTGKYTKGAHRNFISPFEYFCTKFLVMLNHSQSCLLLSSAFEVYGGVYGNLLSAALDNLRILRGGVEGGSAVWSSYTEISILESELFVFNF